ncbi:AMP-binding protein [Actinoplanes sp. NPDC049548]|uniref:AMP-binding protein n=1 Tax=Actinoplanes sp. NPDC049548 TaxID=3155152 RepID=UPI003416C2CF
MDVPAAHSTTAFPTFTEALDRAAARRTAPAVATGAQEWTWADLRDQAGRTAAVLHRHGLRRGDVLATQLPNGWELLVLHAATARLGVVMLPLHGGYREHEVQSLIGQAGAVALVAQGSYRGRDRVAEILAVRDRCPSLAQVWLSGDPRGGDLTSSAELLSQEPAGGLPAAGRDPDAPLLLLASSGTTSKRPKLCVHGHRGLLGNAAAVAADGGLGATDTIVSASPLSHAFGMLSVHLALVTGGAVGLCDGWSPRRFLELLTAVSATAAFAVPAQLRDLLAEVDGGTDARPPATLREVRTGGAPVSRDLAEHVRRAFGARVIVQWGMTEVGAGTYTRPGDPPELTATVGRPVSGGAVRVVGPDGVPVAPGETGDLQYRSPYLFREYYRAPEATRAAFTTDGWLRTGDLAALRPDGAVSYRGRADEVINRGGLKFSGLEVEELLADLPQLAQHAVVAQPDERLGQRSCLVAALREGAELTLDEVTAHLSGKGLATFKLPERLVVLDRLPTTVTGKIARARLRDMVPAAKTAEARR